MRARLWLKAAEVGETDAAPRVWLHLNDGRVLAFRLPDVALGDDRVLAPLAEAVRDDARGMLNGLELPGVGYVHILYAAPVLPIPIPQRGGCIALARHDILDFARSVDADVLDFLGTLGGNDFYASVRNYNRLAALAPEQRLRRMQALRRFPGLVTPLLLTAHRYPNLRDGKRHAWRHPAPSVEAAIGDGRDLTDALAKHYRISRGLVRAPMNAAFWTAGYERRRIFLAMFDALPSNKRPANAGEVERHLAELNAYLYLIEGDEDEAAARLIAPGVHAGAFRLGWTRTWEICQRRFGPLTHALVDTRDFLAAARGRAAALLGRRHGPPRGRLAAAWLTAHGLTGLLAASARWHALRPQIEYAGAHCSLPALLGEWQDADRQARELLTPVALAQEGATMHHCVGDYWDDCVAGDRIFALRLGQERATAQYVSDVPSGDDARYGLEQLRGPANTEASAAMRTFAHDLLPLLNADERRSARHAALSAQRDLESSRQRERQVPAWLDEASERQLHRVLKALACTPVHPEALLVADVAGYAYHAGPTLEDAFAAGQPLELVREPDNPYDPLAVRIDWQGHKIGYVPRRKNAVIAHALDNHQPLAAHIIEAVGRHGDPWQRLEFAIMKTPAAPCTKLAA